MSESLSSVSACTGRVDERRKNAGKFDRFCRVLCYVRKRFAELAGKLIEPVRHFALGRHVFEPVVGHLLVVEAKIRSTASSDIRRTSSRLPSSRSFAGWRTVFIKNGSKCRRPSSEHSTPRRYGSAWSKMFSRVLGSAAASRCEISHYRLAVICRNHAARLANGLRAHRRLDRNAFVNLRLDGRHHVETLVAIGVRYSRPRRSAPRRPAPFAPRAAASPSSRRNDAEQIIFERHDVDDRQRAARIHKHLELAAIRLAVESHRRHSVVERTERDRFQRRILCRFARPVDDHFAQIRIDFGPVGVRRAGRLYQASDLDLPAFLTCCESATASSVMIVFFSVTITASSKTFFGKLCLECVGLFLRFLRATDPNLPRVLRRIDADQRRFAGLLANVLCESRSPHLPTQCSASRK